MRNWMNIRKMIGKGGAVNVPGLSADCPSLLTPPVSIPVSDVKGIVPVRHNEKAPLPILEAAPFTCARSREGRSA